MTSEKFQGLVDVFGCLEDWELEKSRISVLDINHISVIDNREIKERKRERINITRSKKTVKRRRTYFALYKRETYSFLNSLASFAVQLDPRMVS